MLRCCFVLLLLASVLIAQDKKPDASKESPRVLYSVPLSVTPGEKVKITLRGYKLDTLPNVTAKDVQLKLLNKGKKPGPNNFPTQKTGDTEAELELELPKGFIGDSLELLQYNKSLFKFVVDRTPQVKEKEPNDSFASAQELVFPTTVNAKIERDKDVDVYKFKGKAGQVVRVEIHAARLGAPTDTLLTLYDANRRTLATVDDVQGRPDPELTFTLPAEGEYFLSVIESHDVGGPLFPYRLVIK